MVAFRWHKSLRQVSHWILSCRRLNNCDDSKAMDLELSIAHYRKEPSRTAYVRSNYPHTLHCRFPDQGRKGAIVLWCLCSFSHLSTPHQTVVSCTQYQTHFSVIKVATLYYWNHMLYLAAHNHPLVSCLWQRSVAVWLKTNSLQGRINLKVIRQRKECLTASIIRADARWWLAKRLPQAPIDRFNGQILLVSSDYWKTCTASNPRTSCTPWCSQIWDRVYADIGTQWSADRFSLKLRTLHCARNGTTAITACSSMCT